MKSLKKFVAALLVLTMVLAMTSVAFAYKEKALDEDTFVKFKGNAWGFKKVSNNIGRDKKVIVRKGSVARAVAVKGDWYKIAIPKRNKITKNDYFWFNKKYAKIDKSATEEDPLIISTGGTNRSVVEEGVFKTPSLAKMKVKVTGTADMRKTPCLKDWSIGFARKGKTVTLTGKWGVDTLHNRYFQVKYGGKKGYIIGGYIRASDMKKILKKIDE